MFRTCWQGVRKSFSYSQTEFPAAVKAFFQIIFIAITTIITVNVVPSLNQTFEKNERKSAFYSSLINELNGDTKELLGGLSVLINDNISQSKKEDLYIKLRTIATKLHWRSVEFAIIYKDTKIENKILSYQSSLAELERQMILAYKNPKSKVQESAVENFAYASASLLQSLAQDADIGVKK